MAATVQIRSGSTGAMSAALSEGDVLAAIQRGDDIVLNGQTAVLSNMGGAWFVNNQPICAWFGTCGGANVTTVTTPNPTPTLAQVCSGMTPAPALPTPSAALTANLPATFILHTAPTLPPQPLSSSLPPAGCVTLLAAGRMRASSTTADMQSSLDGGAAVLRGDGSLAVIQSFTAPGWPPRNYLIDGNPITAVLGQGFLPGQLDLIHSLAAQGLTISATLESVSPVTYPPAGTPTPSPGPVYYGTPPPVISGTPPNPTHWDTLAPYIIGGAVLYLFLRK